MIEALLSLIERGGWIIALILTLGWVLWCLLIERYWYYFRRHPINLEKSIDEWRNSYPLITHKLQHRQVKAYYSSQLTLALHRRIRLIQSLIAACPMLGLLGTVMGMIQVFDVLAVTGTGNARAMASGVSQATLPTMTGMVVALSSIYFSADLDKRTRLESIRLEEDFFFENASDTDTDNTTNNAVKLSPTHHSEPIRN